MKTFTDDVNGIIIGGDYGMCWVTYEGRKQGNTCYPENEVQADNMCHDIIEGIKTECGTAFSLIYPNTFGWKFHFDGI
jgi:hypothetical protein